MEQIAGLEPASHAWQARIITTYTISALYCQGERITLAIYYYPSHNATHFRRRHPSRLVWLIDEWQTLLHNPFTVTFPINCFQASETWTISSDPSSESQRLSLCGADNGT